MLLLWGFIGTRLPRTVSTQFCRLQRWPYIRKFVQRIRFKTNVTNPYRHPVHINFSPSRLTRLYRPLNLRTTKTSGRWMQNLFDRRACARTSMFNKSPKQFSGNHRLFHDRIKVDNRKLQTTTGGEDQRLEQSLRRSDRDDPTNRWSMVGKEEVGADLNGVGEIKRTASRNFSVHAVASVGIRSRGIRKFGMARNTRQQNQNPSVLDETPASFRVAVDP